MARQFAIYNTHLVKCNTKQSNAQHILHNCEHNPLLYRQFPNNEHTPRLLTSSEWVYILNRETKRHYILQLWVKQTVLGFTTQLWCLVWGCCSLLMWRVLRTAEVTKKWALAIRINCKPSYVQVIDEWLTDRERIAYWW